MKSELRDKFNALLDYLKCFDNIAVAYSAGVDSTFLLKAAGMALENRVLAITVRSCFCPEREAKEAADYCKSSGVKFAMIDFDPLDVENVALNGKDRCYFCKRELLGRIISAASENGFSTVAEGSNADDLLDYRPGMKAVKELGVMSPLCHVGLKKADVRELSRELGLSVWDKPAYACLASRIAYGELITPQKLHRVDAAESFLIDLGFKQMRVRINAETARIEVLEEDMEKILAMHHEITAKLHELGFVYVSLDLDGYRKGSMNIVLDL